MFIKIHPDKEKAKALLKMAETSIERLNQLDKEKYPSNTLIDYYDILKKLIEALNSLEGIKFIKEGAHFHSINYICSKYSFKEVDRELLQELREYRNRIAYEGFNIKTNYIQENKIRIEYLINKLKLFLK